MSLSKKLVGSVVFMGGVSLASMGGCGSDVSTFEERVDGGDGGPTTGSSGFQPGPPTGCTPKTCTDLGATCGKVPDECGNVLECGTCTEPDFCGGGGANKCGLGTGSACVPRTCAEVNANCGPAGDGCGGIIQCGSCAPPESCGGGGASRCGVSEGGTCTKRTCAEAGASCGPAADGCGELLDCGTCSRPGETCGGGGTPSACGVATCRKRTCQEALANCGPVADGCGDLLDCGTCTAPETCGGLVAFQCGQNTSPTCTGLCQQQVRCPDPKTTTTITGKVMSPNGVLPVPNALVYVPNGAVLPFTDKVECGQCGTEVAGGAPLVSDATKADGSFVLKNVPVGTEIPVVIQLGRWRRQFKIQTVQPCVDNPAPPAMTNLPRNKGEGDIPRMAVVTGQLDAMECVLYKIGVDLAEFTNPDGAGRIHLYWGDGALRNLGTALWTPDRLFGREAWPPILPVFPAQPSRLDDYDQVIFDCQGAPIQKTDLGRQNVKSFADRGGRLFLSHFSYVWLNETTPWNQTARFDEGQGAINPATGWIDTYYPKGRLMADWLRLQGALLPGDGSRFSIQDASHDVDRPITPPAQVWIDTKGPETISVQQFTFNTPFEAPNTAAQCGRVTYSNFHVNANNNLNVIMPAHCGGALTTQEKVLAYMLFDLAACIQPDVPPPPNPCVPKSCGALGVGCGKSGDGCGNVIDCGVCTGGKTCGGGGTPNQCGSNGCTPLTCGGVGAECGRIGDGCGGSTECGTCPAGQVCGAAGPNRCGAGACTPRTCAEAGGCGQVADGCGGLIACDCPVGKVCGGGGVANQCGGQTCTPRTCQQAGANCGLVANGCGDVMDCGNCGPGQTCGGGPTANTCGTVR